MSCTVIFKRTLVESIEAEVANPNLTAEEYLAEARVAGVFPDDEEEPDYEFYVPVGPWEAEEVQDEDGDTVRVLDDSTVLLGLNEDQAGVLAVLLRRGLSNLVDEGYDPSVDFSRESAARVVEDVLDKLSAPAGWNRP